MTISIEVWGLKTDKGTLLPFYKVDWTSSQVSVLDGLALYQYWNLFLDVVPAPYWQMLNLIVRDAMDMGGTWAKAIGMGAGRYNYLKGGSKITSGPSQSKYVDASPVAFAWQDVPPLDIVTGKTFSVEKVTGSYNPNVWFNYGVGVTTDMSPKTMLIPSPGVRNGAGPWGGPVSVFMTSDGVMGRLAPQAIGHGTAGWGGVTVSMSTLNPSIYGDMSTYDMEYIRTIEEEAPIVARFNPRATSDNIGIYLMAPFQLRDFGVSLWQVDFSDMISNMLVGDAVDCMLGLRWFFGLADDVVGREGHFWPVLGNKTVEWADAAPSAALNEVVTHDFGSITVPRYYGDYRDWTLTKYTMHLPFIGIIDLDPADVVGQTLWLKYVVNLTDGSAVCNLSNAQTSGTTGNGVIFEASCSWGYDIPMRYDSIKDVAVATASVATKLVAGALGGSMVAGAPGAVLGALGGTVSSASMAGPTYSVGSLAPNANVWADLGAKLVCYRRTDLTGSGLQEAAGAPSGATVSLGDCSGYTEVAVVYNGGVLAGLSRAGEIIQLLRAGVYL